MVGRRSGLAGVAAAALLAVGCAHGNSAAGAADADTEAVVQVANQNWSDMTVYVVRGNVRQRLGMVSSLGTGRFRLPRHIFTSTEPMQLFADPIGGAQPYLSPPLLVNPGQVVEWRLENNMQLSSAFVR